jgi:hypothetical protein
VERRGRGRGIRTMEVEMSGDDRPILLLSCLWFYDGRSFFLYAQHGRMMFGAWKSGLIPPFSVTWLYVVALFAMNELG